MKKIAIAIIIAILLAYLIVHFCGVSLDTESMRNKLEVIKESLKETYVEKKKIKIVTLETRDMELLTLHNKNVSEYALKHGYEYLFLKEYNNKLKLPIYWSKIQLVLELLQDKTNDYVMWMDSDTMICHPEIPLEYIINQDDKSIYIGLDYPATDRYNAGVFIIKNDEDGNKFLNDCIQTYTSREKCIENVDGKIEYKLNGGWSGECYEQGIMNELLFSAYEKKCCSLDKIFLMNIGSPISDTFILHLHSGLSKNKEDNAVFFQKISNGERIDTSVKTQFQYLVKKFIKLFNPVPYVISLVNYYRFNRGHYNDIYPTTKLLLKKTDYLSETKPKFFQTYHDKKKIPKYVYENIATYAPEYSHIILDDNEAEVFLDEYYQPEVLHTFRILEKGAHKADLLRYCLLYVYGGVYMDIHKELLVPARQLFPDKNTIYSTIAHTRNHITQGLISTPVRHPLFLSLIYYIVKTGNPYGYHDFCMDFKYQVELDLGTDVKNGANKSKNVEYYFLNEKCSTDTILCKKLDSYGLCCVIYDRGRHVINARRSCYPW